MTNDLFKKYFGKSIFLILLCLPLLDLLHPGLPLTHDGQDHVARIANFYQNLTQGVLIPRWAANLNWGYGHPILEFLYPLPSYIASFFHAIGLSLINSTKVVYALGMVLSGIGMYLWVSAFTNKKSGFLSGILYVIAPYRFVELYVRGDIGENLAFAFMPFALYFMYRYSKKQQIKNIVGISFSMAFLILAHNAISLMYAPFLLFYIFYLAWHKKYLLPGLLFGFLSGFGIAAFFWIPALLEGKYTLRDIVTAGAYKNRFVTLFQLVYGKWSYGGSGEFTVQLGIINWFVFIVTPIMYWVRAKKKNIFFVLSLAVYTFCAIALMLPITSSIWSHIKLLQNFQFPWRFLAIPLFTTATLAGLFVFKLKTKFQLAALSILIGSIIFSNYTYWHANGYLQKPQSFFTSIYYGTTDTGESAPIWSVRFMEHQPKAHLQSIDNTAKIVETKRTTIQHVYTVQTTQNTKFLENTLYFPGWAVFVDGKQVPVEFQNQQFRGLMTFFVPAGKHKISIRFRESKIRLLSDILSLATLCILCLVPMMSKKFHFSIFKK